MIVGHIKEEDIQLALLYQMDNPNLSREELGCLLEKEGMGAGHHTFSGCSDKVEYINLVLDSIMPEW